MMITEYELFNSQVVEAIMNGTMEGKIRWMCAEYLGLLKRVKYHEQKLTESWHSNQELEKRLQDYRHRLETFDPNNARQNFITKIRLVYGKENLPKMLYGSTYYTRFPAVITSSKEYSVDVKFVINFEEAKRKRVFWSVVEINPKEIARLKETQGSYFTYQCKDLDKIPKVLLTLPALITSEVMVKDLETLPVYVHSFKNG